MTSRFIAVSLSVRKSILLQYISITDFCRGVNGEKKALPTFCAEKKTPFSEVKGEML
jgi:hypothetical protein